jgi:hypothetical protein
MERAIKDLAKLGDTEFFDQVAKGLQLIAEEVRRIDDAATGLSDDTYTSLLSPERNYPAPILSVVGAEEAAKTLILIDSVRCPVSKSKERTRTLGYFYDHLAKTIYAEACRWRAANFAQLSRLITLDRQMYYLDGPTGADWIFYNGPARCRPPCNCIQRKMSFASAPLYIKADSSRPKLSRLSQRSGVA